MKLFVCILTDETDFDLKRIYIFWIGTWICNSLLHIAHQVFADFGVKFQSSTPFWHEG